MALKFLNKKGWHTGSLRNIENVWKAEQKHEAEQRKLEELRKQILEERERDEFRQLQEQAGITPRQERLEFLYDSGLAVGKTSSDGFKVIETIPGSDASASGLEPESEREREPASSAAPMPVPGSTPSSSNAAVPGALFEDKPQSANDAWRKLHTDPLLMIRQREQEALARIKNNPVKMAMIRKSVESQKQHDNSHDKEHKKVKSKHKKHSSKHHSGSESDGHEERERKRKMKHRKEHRSDIDSDTVESERKRKVKNKKKSHYYDSESDSDSLERERERKRKVKNKKKSHYSDSESYSDGERGRERERGKVNNKTERLEFDDNSRGSTRHHRHSHRDYESEKQYLDRTEGTERNQRGYEKSKYEAYRSDHRNDKYSPKATDDIRSHQLGDSKQNGLPPKHDFNRRRGRAPQLTEEERAARLREMQMDAEVHEEQRWKRLKKAEEDDAREASQTGSSRGKSFLHSVQKSVYGAEKGGSSTIEESVRRRTHFLQGRTADESNAFRR